MRCTVGTSNTDMAITSDMFRRYSSVVAIRTTPRDPVINPAEKTATEWDFAFITTFLGYLFRQAVQVASNNSRIELY